MNIPTGYDVLPVGWDMARDASNRLYFINHLTKTTQWIDPRPLPWGWDQKVDPKTSRTYYVNHNKKLTSWKDPRPPLNYPPLKKPKAFVDDVKKGDGKGKTPPDGFDWYRDVLKMCLLDKQISPEQLELLANVRRKLSLSDKQHDQLLYDVGWTPQEFNSAKQSAEASSISKECVVCLEGESTHIVLDCMHICLCAQCAIKVKNANNRCPKCRVEARDIRKVY